MSMMTLLQRGSATVRADELPALVGSAGLVASLPGLPGLHLLRTAEARHDGSVAVVLADGARHLVWGRDKVRTGS